MPPMLLIIGDKDKLVPYYQTLEMDTVLQNAGVKHGLIVMPGMNHSLIGATYAATRGANLNALQKTLQFIDQTIGTSPRRSACQRRSGPSGMSMKITMRSA